MIRKRKPESGTAFLVPALSLALLVAVLSCSASRAAGKRLPVRVGAAAVDAPSVSLPASVSVRILSRLRPSSLEVDGPRHLTVTARRGKLLVDGRFVEGPLELPVARWRVRAPGELPRWYGGRLTFRLAGTSMAEGVPGGQTPAGDELVVVATLPLETYVSDVTASETELDTPPAALRAQAIVARSYVAAAGRRHPEADACDMAHCQVLRGDSGERHRTEARAAAKATRGQVLRLASGEIALAPFHGACGGQTADPGEVFGGRDRSGAATVADPGCPQRRWEARVTRATVERAAAQALAPNLAGRGDRSPPRWADLELQRGHGGYIVRVVDRRRGVVGSGDAFVRALAGEAGWNAVRGGRFDLMEEGGMVEGDAVGNRLGRDRADRAGTGARRTVEGPSGAAVIVVRGQGTGHGVGLCQLGAARSALQGQGHEAILKRYFPLASVVRE